MIAKLKRKALRSLQQSYPNGLVSLRYLLPFQSVRVKQHRNIWWASKHHQMPRIIWIVEQFIFWLRWVLFSAWAQSFSTVKFFNASIAQNYGISYFTQLRRCLSLSLGWCIPPHQLYNYYVIQHQNHPLDFVYDIEATGWHALQNQDHPNRLKSQLLLGDKQAFAETMLAQGMPVVQSLPSFDPTRPLSDQIIADMGNVFCKLRTGNQALAAFEAGNQNGKLIGKTHDGDTLDANGVDSAWRKLSALGNVIVQPCLRNHPIIEKTTELETLATLRIITHRGQIGASNITLPITMDDKPAAIWLDINTQTGVPTLPANMYPDYDPKITSLKEIASRAPDILPFWDQMCRDSLTMHNDHFDLWAVAWDWAITPDGPRVLEGNAGWGPADWQLQNGGWFKENASKS